MKLKQMSEQEALSKLMTICAQSEHCEHDCREKMIRWKIERDAQDRIIDKLKDGNYIDEERFCRAFVKDKLMFNHWGRRKIEAALFQKRIQKSISTPILDEIPIKDYIENLKPLIASKKRQIDQSLPDYDIRQRLIRYAVGRGFTFDVIKEVVDTDGFEDTDY